MPSAVENLALKKKKKKAVLGGGTADTMSLLLIRFDRFGEGIWHQTFGSRSEFLTRVSLHCRVD